ncbi:MAG: RIP metalloprotease RseP [Candidatus Jorgensenbacteria bacterium GW2011_GWA1_48_13]|uniref:Zinc metalloprotease n=2 Tax=Candidatus Joergenseniibacteriota TaxID=1752739 RepID=A0A0G1W9P7_9BACT|nr:MAG: RIP metalloprotease RseP [Candidatus Jorgensenbacteria bacterium GW2011_GWA1_48_13]KKU99097.1 MAG: RIP metalloprotease RseP [Candidatus Jorgensenbacteria bacterium GW2011_GWC1_48_8]KKW15493.1 MAG: RIP metalloprotease RseP [Candidatus Jorgensenbacteria bacterium GW2011_GWB1_50_10]
MIIVLVVVGLSLLILVHEFGHFLAAKLSGVKVEEFGLGFPPRLFGKKIGETIYSINLLPFGGFVRIFGEDGSEETKRDEKSFSNQPISHRSAIILAGVIMNVILGWLILSLVFAIGAPEHLMIAEVAPGSPAAEAKLKSGDVILEARTREVLSDPVRSSAFVDLVENAPGEVFLKLKRGKDVFETTLAPRREPPAGQGPIGVSLVEIGIPSEPILKSFYRGLTATFRTLVLVAVGLWTFFSRLFVSPEVLETVAGPVGIFALSAQAGYLGLVYLFQLLAFISLNLAVLNLIPFPALDGGRFLLLIIEKIKGKPISRRFQVVVNAAGFVFLIVLMLIVTWRDVLRILE